MSSPARVLLNIKDAIREENEGQVARWLKHPRLETDHAMAENLLVTVLFNPTPVRWLELLVPAGFSIQGRLDISGRETLLHIAASKRDAPTLKWLVEHGAPTVSCSSFFPIDNVLKGVSTGAALSDCVEPIRVLWKSDPRLSSAAGHEQSTRLLRRLLVHGQAVAVVEMLLMEGWDPCLSGNHGFEEVPSAWDTLKESPELLETSAGRLIQAFVLRRQLEDSLPPIPKEEKATLHPRF